MSKIQLNKVFPLLLAAAMLTMFSFGCEKEVEKIVEVTVHDTLSISLVTANLNAAKDSIPVGTKVMLSASATKDAKVGDVMFQWAATAGSFDMTVGDTVYWTAPDTEGIYTVTVNATDGEFIGSAAMKIGVGMYAPTVEPYYMTVNTCKTCHSGKATGWAETGHAQAWEALQTSSHARESCYRCHTLGYDGPTGNGGYDESAVKVNLEVQCENCHGPGSQHYNNGNPDPTKINQFQFTGPNPDSTYDIWDAEVCGNCHNGSHHGFYEEWVESPHGKSLENHGSSSASCQGCHEGLAAANRLSDKATIATFYGSGSGFRSDADTIYEPKPIGCTTCHDPHSKENEHQLRTLADVPLITSNGESPVITVGGTGKICMHCHHARRGPDAQVTNGYSHFGPHGNPQADMALGKSAAQWIAGKDFNWAGPSHLNIEDACRTCHMDKADFNGTVAIHGHSFIPKVTACQRCHGEITEFKDIMALDDFDGNGKIEGVQVEVRGLVKLLEEALLTDGLDTTGSDFEHVLGDTAKSTLKQREAGYNMVFVESDKSSGVHNPDYAVQLLQQSIKYLTGSLPASMAVLDGNKKVTAKF